MTRVTDSRAAARRLRSRGAVDTVGVAAIAGLVVLHTGDPVVGTTLVLASCAYMFAAGIMMGVADALGYYPRKGDGIPGTVAASLPPLVALVAATF